MARKKFRGKLWRELSAPYRRRLERLGLTSRNYRSPRPEIKLARKAARGHAPRNIPPGGGPSVRGPDPRNHSDYDYKRFRGKQQKVYGKILGWFPDDGFYDPRRKILVQPSYHSSQGWSWDPANEFTVALHVDGMDDDVLDEILSMTREQYRRMASVNELFWYH